MLVSCEISVSVRKKKKSTMVKLCFFKKIKHTINLKINCVLFKYD